MAIRCTASRGARIYKPESVMSVQSWVPNTFDPWVSMLNNIIMRGVSDTTDECQTSARDSAGMLEKAFSSCVDVAHAWAQSAGLVLTSE